MDANKIQINTGSLTGNTEFFIKLPIGQSFGPVDQSDIINRKFVETGVRASINPIIDYERVRFLPFNDGGVSPLTFVKYKLDLIDGDTYGDIGFVNDDLRFRRNNLKESFLRLSFYNNDKPTIADKLFEMTISPQFINPSSGTFEDEYLEFTLSDPITNPSGFAEGFFLYHKKYNEEYLTTGVTIYMKAEFNNAKTGISHKLMTKSTPAISANEIIEHIYTKYILKRIGDSYIYYLDTSFNQNINYINNEVVIKLYETEIV